LFNFLAQLAGGAITV